MEVGEVSCFKMRLLLIFCCLKQTGVRGQLPRGEASNMVRAQILSEMEPFDAEKCLAGLGLGLVYRMVVSLLYLETRRLIVLIIAGKRANA